MKTAIIIPYNTAEKITLECIEALERTTKDNDTYCIVINGYVKEPNPIEHPFIDKLITVKNESYCKTINAGFREIPEDCKRVFFMGNDSIALDEGWLTELERIHDKHELAVTSPDYTKGGKDHIVGENDDVWYHTMLPSIHYYMTMEDFNKVGLMDERFTGACYYSDDDYCQRVEKLFGTMKIGRCKNIIFEHKCSVEGVALGITHHMSINYKTYKEIQNER